MEVPTAPAEVLGTVAGETTVTESFDATAPAAVVLPATSVVSSGSYYQPAATLAGTYYQPSTIAYQTLPAGYQSVNASTITYQGVAQTGSLLRDRTPFTFTVDAKDEKDTKEEKAP